MESLIDSRFCLAAGLLCVLLASIMPGCGGGSVTTSTASVREQAGDSFEAAITVGSIGEQLDVMNGAPCGDGGFFRKTHVEVVERGGRHYDVVDAACTSGNQTRKFYFDVSSCFPCPD